MSDTELRVLSDRDILKITPEGICFGDPASPEWILFAECRSNGGRGVGERNICARPPYIRLNTTPPTEIRFLHKGFPQRLQKKKAERRFVEFHWLMEKYGAYTRDLS